MCSFCTGVQRSHYPDRSIPQIIRVCPFNEIINLCVEDNFIEMYHAVYRQKVIVNTADMISRARYLDMYNEAVILT